MTDIFVSLDVETTGPCPGIGELATIGAVAYHGETLEELDRVYCRLEPAGHGYIEMVCPITCSFHGTRGHQGAAFMHELGDYVWRFEESTRRFWAEQAPAVRAEAFGDKDRRTAKQAAMTLDVWLKGLPGTPVFVAHPVGFDWAWINHLFLTHIGPNATHNPFGYRPLCLRALGWALGDGAKWGQDRTDSDDFHVPSKIPHHALSDAEAQGETLVRVLREIRRRADMSAEPTGGTTHGVGLLRP